MLKVLKKLSMFCIVVTMVVGLVRQNVQAEMQGPDVCADGYCVLDWETGEVIISKNKDEKLYPASITKVLTALVVVENVDDLDETITFSKYAIESLSVRSSTLNPTAQIGEQMTVRQALYGMLLVSANECATALAEYTGGSEKNFAEMMNKRAKEIGATNSHFVNAHGLHDKQHYTTPYDIALIFSEVLRNETVSEILQTTTYTIPATNKSDARNLQIGHGMLNGKESYEGVFAGKTGRTEQAGRTLLTACEREGHTLISSLMKSEDYKFYLDQKIIFDYAFGQVTGTMSTPFQWDEKEETVWATGNVTIREYPSIYSISVGILEEGQSLTRLATYEKWSMVQCESGVYYIGSAYLTTEDPNHIGGSTVGNSSEPETTEPVEETHQTMEEATTEAVNETVDSLTGESQANEPSNDDRNEWSSFLKKNWIYIIDGVVVLGILDYVIIRVRNKSKNSNTINRGKYRKRKNKW